MTWREEWKEMNNFGRWFDTSFDPRCATYTVVKSEIVVAVRISADDRAVYSIGHDSNFTLTDLESGEPRFDLYAGRIVEHGHS